MSRLISNRLGLCALLGASLCLNACDSAGSAEGDVSINGRVTNDSGYGKTVADIEGATVTAANVSFTGNSSPLEGSATTDVQGRYSLQLDDPGELIVVRAEKDEFETSALVVVDGEGSVNAIPMTTESDVEVRVYVDAKSADPENDVTVADVVLYVTQQVAAEVETGSTSIAEIAAAIRGESQARLQYMREQEEEEGEEYEVEDVQHEQQEAFLELQADLSLAANSSSQAAVLENFEEALLEGYTEGGVSAETHAKARIAGRAALIHMSEDASAAARFHLRKRAEILTAWARAQAVEVAFEAQAAGSARLDALQSARADLVAELRAATSAEDLADAGEEYDATVQDELAAELGVSTQTVATARLSLAALEAALTLSLEGAGNADAVVDAYTEFFAAADAALMTAFTGNVDAQFAASVLTLLAVH